MQKRISEIFPTSIVEYDNPNFLVENANLIDAINTLEFIISPTQPYQTVDNRLNVHPKFQEIFKWINLCIEDYRTHYKFQCKEFKISIAWVNKTDSTGSHRIHTHPNSFISGVYYLTADGEPTVFVDPRPQIRNGILVRSNIDHSVWPSSAKIGRLILFPSWLEHYTGRHRLINDTRYTLSFNVMPNGIVDPGGLNEAVY